MSELFEQVATEDQCLVEVTWLVDTHQCFGGQCCLHLQDRVRYVSGACTLLEYYVVKLLTGY
jgi:hypothetical protein